MNARITSVIPAILTNDSHTMRHMIRQVEGFADYVQFDITDGKFVPSHSITTHDLSEVTITLKWEAHLMVQRPIDYLKDFRNVGAVKVIFHLEALSSTTDTISLARNLGLQVGIAINPETGIDGVINLIKSIDSVVFMTVNPGFYGSQFLPEVLNKVGKLRHSYPELKIGVDGGIKKYNIADVVRCGVDDIYIGSAIFQETDPASSYRRLQTLARQASKKPTK